MTLERPDRAHLGLTRPTVELSTTLPTPTRYPLAPEAEKLLTGRGLYRLTGVAGSGVTTTLINVIAHRIAASADPSGIIVLTGTKDSAQRLRHNITLRLMADGTTYASTTSLVKSVHSLAYAIVRDHANYVGNPAPRLLTGAEHDAIIREILIGTLDDGGGYWPVDIQPALPMVGFARGLRDFLLRAQERGIGADELRDFGATYDRPLWVAAGDFLDEYHAIAALSGTHQLNASELTSRALAALNDPDTPNFADHVLSGIHTLIVDDAHNLDPKAAKLITTLAAHTRTTIIAGDTNQAVYHFRGGDPRFLANLPVDDEHDIHLSKSHRNPTTRALVTANTTTAGHNIIADTLRRSHLIGHRPFGEHVVIVREASDIPPLRRALLAAGVPVTQDPTDLILAEHPLVDHILLALSAAHTRLTPTQIEALALGPVGGADPVTLRRLIRGLRQAELSTGGNRRALHLLADLLHPDDTCDEDQHQADITRAFTHLTDRERTIFDHLHRVLNAARESAARGDSVELALWNVWEATGLDQSLNRIALRGGARGSQADQALDAMMSLFDLAGDFVERRPTASINRFITTVREQQLPTNTRDRRVADADAVNILTAHAVTGRSWPFVIIAGVQEDSWPTIGETGTLFAQEELVDLIDHQIDPRQYISRAGEKLAEEHRLFHMATHRATDTLIITTVNSADGEDQREPSRFLDDLDDTFTRYQAEDILNGTSPHLITNPTSADSASDSDSASDNEGTNEDTDEHPTEPAGETEDTTAHDNNEVGEKNTSAATDVGAVATDGAKEDAAAAAQSAQPALPVYDTHNDDTLLPSPLLAVPTIVAELRRIVCDTETHPRLRTQAARQLARLAHAGIHTAHPDYWWGELPPTTNQPLTDTTTPITLSPSAIENIHTCPARTIITRLLPTNLGNPAPMTFGTLIHAIAEALSKDVDPATVTALAHAAYDATLTGPEWETSRLHNKLDTTIDTTRTWLASHNSAADQVDLEATVIVDIPGDSPQTPDIRIKGRADRIEYKNNQAFIQDLKTSSTIASAADSARNLQLATYQLALAHADRTEDGNYRTHTPGGNGPIDVGGASLVYVTKSHQSDIATTRHQAPLDEDAQAATLALLRETATESTGPSLITRSGPHCLKCPIRNICPHQAEGRMTTHEP